MLMRTRVVVPDERIAAISEEAWRLFVTASISAGHLISEWADNVDDARLYPDERRRFFMELAAVPHYDGDEREAFLALERVEYLRQVPDHFLPIVSRATVGVDGNFVGVDANGLVMWSSKNPSGHHLADPEGSHNSQARRKWAHRFVKENIANLVEMLVTERGSQGPATSWE